MRTLLFFLSSSIAVAQGFAPDSLNGKAFAVSYDFGVSPFASDGTSTVILTSSTWYFTEVSGDVGAGQSATYTYDKISENIGRMNSSNESLGNTTTVLTFLNEFGGTFTNGFPGQPAQQSGSFSLVPIPTKAPLSNISTRATITAGGVLQPGFVVDGDISRRVLVRAIGPTLADFGVSNAMPDPTLEILQDGARVAFNDDWETNAASTFAQVGAFALGNASRDAAAVLTLTPGVYNVIVKNKDDSTGGDVLLEVYFVE
jgi:hypothetical protein